MGVFFNIVTASNKVSGGGTPIEPHPIQHDVYIIPQYGQSLALNQNGTPTTYTATEPLSYDKTLVNNNVQESIAGVAESFRIMAEIDGITLPANFKVIGTVNGSGGTSIAGLSKGTGQYNNLLASVQTAKNSCDTAGLTCVVPCFTWTQGEENMRTGGVASNYGTGTWNPLTYNTQLQQLITDLNTDIKAITGQTSDIICISYQVASHNPYGRYPRIAMELDLSAKNNANHVVGLPMYSVDYSTDEVHAVPETYRFMGNMYGVAAWKLAVRKEQVNALRMSSYSLTGSTLDIVFDVPEPPLVLDTTLITQLTDGNYGFNVCDVVNETDGANGTIAESVTRINSVSLLNDTTVRLNLSRVPVAGERITYGVNGGGWEKINGIANSGKSGRVDGARGCLRDSQSFKNNNAGSVYTDLYNWSVIFEIQL